MYVDFLALKVFFLYGLIYIFFKWFYDFRVCWLLFLLYVSELTLTFYFF